MKYILTAILLFNVAFGQSLFGVVAGDGRGLDPNARVYIDSVDNYVTVTDVNQRRIDTLFKKLKGRIAGYTVNYWDSIVAFYPVFGANANTHSINGKLPSANRITWGGTVTHTISGAQGNGSTGFGDVNGITQASLGTNNFGFGVYVVPGGGSGNCEIGFAQTTPSNDRSYIYTVSGGNQYAANSGTTDTTISPTTLGAFHFVNRRSSASFDAWLNTTKRATVFKASVTAGTIDYYVLARNVNNSVNTPSGSIHGFWIFTTGLSDTAITAIRNIIHEYNQSLGRGN